MMGGVVVEGEDNSELCFSMPMYIYIILYILKKIMVSGKQYLNRDICVEAYGLQWALYVIH